MDTLAHKIQDSTYQEVVDYCYSQGRLSTIDLLAVFLVTDKPTFVVEYLKRTAFKRDVKVGDYLVLAARHSGTESVAALIKAGFAVNKKDVNGFTPLHEAVRANKIENVRVLLENGADKSLVDGVYGLTSVEYATLLGHREILDIFDKHEWLRVNAEVGKIVGALELLHGNFKTVVESLDEDKKPIDLKNDIRASTFDNDLKTFLDAFEQYRRWGKVKIAKAADTATAATTAADETRVTKEAFGVKVVSPADMADMYGGEDNFDDLCDEDWMPIFTEDKRKMMTGELYKWCKYFIARTDDATALGTTLSINFLLNFASQITAHSGFWVPAFRTMDDISVGVSEIGYYYPHLDSYDRLAHFEDGKVPESSDL